MTHAHILRLRAETRTLFIESLRNARRATSHADRAFYANCALSMMRRYRELRDILRTLSTLN